MIRRPTWILLTLFIVILAAALLWQRSEENKSASEPTPTLPARLLDIDANTIRDIKIDDDQNNRLFLRKLGGGLWIMTEPERQNLDLEELNARVTQLSLINIMTTLQPAPEADEIGLLPPAYTLTITDEAGKKYILDVGSETPTQSGYYVRMNGSIYVVSKFNIDGMIEMLENPPIAPPTGTPTGAVAPQEVITGTAVTTTTP